MFAALIRMTFEEVEVEEEVEEEEEVVEEVEEEEGLVILQPELP